MNVFGNGDFNIRPSIRFIFLNVLDNDPTGLKIVDCFDQEIGGWVSTLLLIASQAAKPLNSLMAVYW